MHKDAIIRNALLTILRARSLPSLSLRSFTATTALSASPGPYTRSFPSPRSSNASDDDANEKGVPKHTSSTSKHLEDTHAVSLPKPFLYLAKALSRHSLCTTIGLG